MAICLSQVSRKDIVAIQLAKQLGMTEKTARFMLHRLRETVDSAWAEKLLEGDVEIDEVYVGGRATLKHRAKKVPGTQGRSTRTKAQVGVGLRERGSGRTRLFLVRNVNSANVREIIQRHVVRGSRIHTDEASIYGSLPGYQHVAVNHSADEWKAAAGGSINAIKSLWAVFRRGLYGGTYPM